jgi:hypothetical protein
MSESAKPVTTANLSNAVRAKKLTVERIFGKPPAMVAGDKIKYLCDVYCYVTGSKKESSPYGEYYRWLGEFKSINLDTGEVLVAANAIFPGIASDVIEAAYIGGNNIGGDASNVMLAFRLGTAETSAKPNKAGYVYVLQDIVAPNTQSPLDMMYAERQRVAITDQSAGPAEAKPTTEPAKPPHKAK